MAYKLIESNGYKIKDYSIPYSYNGYYDYGKSEYVTTGNKKYLGYLSSIEGEVCNFVFTAKIRLDRSSRGRSSTKIHFENTLNGEWYEMFPADAITMIQNNIVTNGEIEGDFSFVKKGSNYGLVWMNPETKETK